MQGYEIPAAAWEPEILARRVANYDPGYLDQLCLSGEVMWGRLSRHPAMEEDAEGKRVRPSRNAPLSFFLRESLGSQGSQTELPAGALSHPAESVLAVLRERGASFFADLARGSGRLPCEVEDALWELVAAGLVTADSFENLRSLMDQRRRKTVRPRHAGGRWALLEARIAQENDVAAFADQLMKRWGVLIRDLLAREAMAPFWRDLLPVLRRKEAKGELRGGRFVAGFSGEQFASPEALDLLRRVRRSDTHPEDGVQISNADPLNLAGIVLPGPRVSTLATGKRQLLMDIQKHVLSPSVQLISIDG
jgi:ATP-dependent Lhr-like helicase